ncbi:hypothetical protein GEV38_25020 [Pseudomonas sp. 13159349]|uniref:type ISP restriction/modification enzyme n=1 Tax=Pseudomonas TaxID=286 RepID=UPI000A0F8F09|nr:MULTISPECIES: type ISP restriction/modification enzyme [Pseudomonas]ORL70382.1 hypothetical protein B7H19_05575 [Pseudomonas putida]QKK99018.1 hypothetical protein GEV38_25020 [Pseudomonas sp. 13159349]
MHHRHRIIVLGDKGEKSALALFENYSNGVKTQRDAWAFNSSKTKLETNMSKMIGFYNAEVERFNAAYPELDAKVRQTKVDGFINTDPARISWTVNLKQDLGKNSSYACETECITRSLYRPFTKQWLYYNRRLNERVYQMLRIFPGAGRDNLAINTTSAGGLFSVLITDTLPSKFVGEDVAQWLPLYLYEESAKTAKDELFAEPVEGGLRRRDAITDAGLAHFQSAYPGEQICKEDLFYYVYGILHSPDYRERFPICVMNRIAFEQQRGSEG